MWPRHTPFYPVAPNGAATSGSRATGVLPTINSRTHRGRQTRNRKHRRRSIHSKRQAGFAKKVNQVARKVIRIRSSAGRDDQMTAYPRRRAAAATRDTSPGWVSGTDMMGRSGIAVIAGRNSAEHGCPPNRLL